MPNFSSFGTAFGTAVEHTIHTAIRFGTAILYAELHTKPISFIDAIGTAILSAVHTAIHFGTAILSAERRTKPIPFVDAIIDANYY